MSLVSKKLSSLLSISAENRSATLDRSRSDSMTPTITAPKFPRLNAKVQDWAHGLGPCLPSRKGSRLTLLPQLFLWLNGQRLPPILLMSKTPLRIGRPPNKACTARLRNSVNLLQCRELLNRFSGFDSAFCLTSCTIELGFSWVAFEFSFARSKCDSNLQAVKLPGGF